MKTVLHGLLLLIREEYHRENYYKEEYAKNLILTCFVGNCKAAFCVLGQTLQQLRTCLYVI